jgi:hypothetical protein
MLRLFGIAVEVVPEGFAVIGSPGAWSARSGRSQRSAILTLA